MKEKHPHNKMLSRTSSIEIIRSKTVLLQESEGEEKNLESTTMNIVTESNKAKFEAIELKIQVDPSTTHPGGISYTRGESDRHRIFCVIIHRKFRRRTSTTPQ